MAPAHSHRRGVGVSVDDKPAFLRVRVSRTPYAVFGTIWGGLSIPFLIAARTEPSFLSLAIVALGTCGGFILWLSRYRLEVNDGILTYRTLFTGCRSLPVKDIARLKAVSGYESMKDDTKPFFRVVVEPKAGTPYANLSINLNVFRREDINHLKQFLSRHGVDVRDA